jgi:hypothetical protein
LLLSDEHAFLRIAAIDQTAKVLASGLGPSWKFLGGLFEPSAVDVA